MQEPSAEAAKAQVFPEAEQQQLRCPRCDSTNTKFCYYNNYNLSQPRHFCKSCRRYWTHGGTLRNIPIGGASRKPKPKSKRSSPSSPTSPSPIPKRPNSREPSSILCPPATEKRQLLEVNGSLGSLLASERQFENLMHGFQFLSDGSDVMGLPKSSNTSDQYHLQSSNGSSGTEGENPTEDLLGLLGDSNCWANWWPDLTIE